MEMSTDVTAIAALASDMSATRTQNTVAMAVLKKAMQSEGAAVLPLVAAATGVNPEHLGQNVDTFA